MNKGFSLVELSIVLVILGLLSGGIIGGKSLIRAAELRSVSMEIQGFQTAIMMFEDKYFALPGDMRNAERFWGTETKNGNGDGYLEEDAVANGRESEGFMMWNQLAHADLITGSYTGHSGPNNTYEDIPGVNTPESDLDNACYHLENATTVDTSREFNLNRQRNYIEAGNHDGVDCDDKFLKPEEAWNIDKKIDDGKPATGNLMARHYSTCTTATGTLDTSAEYDVSNTSKECSLIFQGIFR